MCRKPFAYHLLVGPVFVGVFVGLFVTAQAQATELFPDLPDLLELFATPPNSVDGANGLFVSNATLAGVTTDVAGADDFEVDFNAKMRAVVFWTLEEVGSTWDETLEYAVWQDVGGGKPADTPMQYGIGQDVTREHTATLTTRSTFAGDITYNQYQYSFKLESGLGLAGNTRYWLSLYLGQPINLTLQNAFLWNQTTAPPSGALASPALLLNANTAPPGDPNWFATTGLSLAFEIYGSIPNPGTLLLLLPALMVGSVVRGLASRRHRTETR
jgi:hypothetical protein